MELEKLYQKAKEAMSDAYVPYSNFKVGAVVVTKDGKIFTGCNVENASFNGNSCAERTALYKAISEGYREFEKIMVIANSEKPCAPCGTCRQAISEFFEKDAKVIMTNLKKEYLIKTVEELLPYSFGPKDLEK